MSTTTKTDRRADYAAQQARREALAAEFARLAALLGEECPKNVRSWGTPLLQEGISRMTTRLGTPQAVQPVAPVPSKPATCHEGTVANPVQDGSGVVRMFVHQTTTTAGLTFRPATAKEAMAFLLGTVHTVAEYDALMDAMGEQGQRRVDAIKAADKPAAAAPKADKPAAQAPAANEPVKQVATTPAATPPTFGRPSWPR